MNDQTTTDGEDTPDERVLAALRDVEPMAPEVRRAHLHAALTEYDRRDADIAPVVPVVPLRRRSTRVLQVAAAIVLVVVGAAVVVRVGSDGAKDDRASTSAESVASGGADSARDSIESTLAPAPEDASAANGFVEGAPSPAAGTASDAAVPGTAPDLGAFATVDDVISAFGTASQAVAGLERRYEAGKVATTSCGAPVDLGPVPELVGVATVAEQRRLVWVVRDADGVVAEVALVDPTTCARAS